MSDGFPSMTALLGLLAVAGYQNRDRLSEWLGGGHATVPPQPGSARLPLPPSGAGIAPGGPMGTLAGGHDVGSFLGSGIGELVDRFKQSGQGAVADSWVQHGPNQPIGPQQMEQAIGADTLASLTERTGLTREEILARLARELPQAVDHYTPDGRLPLRG